MTPEEWEKIQSAFQHALTLTAGDLATYLAKLELDDPGLCDKVRRMLDEDREPGDGLMEPVAAAAASFAKSRRDAWIGESFGNFKAVEKIASGGMSAVYLGTRDDDQYEQTVAIKIVAGNFQTEELFTRFKTERQILASLSHHYIGQLYDGGTTGDGTPYLVMDYIDGLPIDEYCNRNVLSIADRLKLFGKVCSAVDFAHRNLIVHRDIKPSNILVTRDGTPKLIDFGIAKPLEKAAMSRTIALTQENARAMTPEYASPEQVRGETITTSTDVYSLGVLLYKILSGHMPYVTHGTNVAAVAQAICETEPSRPSTVITQISAADDEPQNIVVQRGTSLGRLRRMLAGDLDNIVMVTLQKDPARRYASAKELNDDIERYLACQPVNARADSIFYRTNRFVRRHRWGVATAVAFLAVVIGLPSFYSVQVAKQRDRAQLEAAKSARISDFMLSLFDAPNPEVAQGDSMTARAMLDQGARRINFELADQPELRAAMQDVMGGAYRGLGLYAQSQALLDAALQTRTQLLGPGSPDVLQTTSRIASLAYATGDYAKSERIHREALAMSREIHGEQSVMTAAVHAALASAIFEQGRRDEAREQFATALAIHNRISADPSLPKAMIMHGYGWLLTNTGEFELAESMLQAAVDMLRTTVGEQHPELQAALNHLAYLQMDTAQWPAAETTIREAMTLSLMLFGEAHPDVSGNMFTLGTVLQETGRLAEAEDLFRQGLEIDVRVLGPEHPYIATDKNNLASLLKDRGKYAEAERLYREALALNRQLHGAEHPESITSQSNLGLLLVQAGNFAAAEPLLRGALETRRENLGDENPATLTSQVIYSAYLYSIEDYAASRSLFEDALGKRRRVFGERSPKVANTLLSYAELLRDMGQLDAATEAAMLGVAIHRESLGDAYPAMAKSLYILGSVVAQTGDVELALNSYESSLERYRQELGNAHPNVAMVLTAYGDLLVETGALARAQPMLQEALTIRQNGLPDGHWEIGVSQSVLGNCLSELGRDDAAIMLEQGLALLERTRGTDNIETRRAAARLAAHRVKTRG